MNDSQAPDVIELRLRQTFQTVAQTVTDESFSTTGPSVTRSRGKRIALGAGALAIPVAFAAAAVVNRGPEYVDTISPERIIMEGSVDGSRYLLVETARTDSCDRPVAGVELVELNENILGSEWNTTGHEYGEASETGCGYDISRYLENPALFTSSGSEVGDSFVWVYAVHPDVTTVRITSGDYAEDLTVYEVDGAGYAPFEFTTDMEEYTVELLINGQVVPGSRETSEVPELP